MKFDDLRARFDGYVNAYRDSAGVLPDAMRCKYDHTFDVVKCAEEISLAENFSRESLFLAKTCALFHDIARFEQVRKFHTFSDTVSKFDHGREAVRILLEENMLSGFSPEDFLTVVTAVELHNKKEIPPGLGELFLPFAKLTRDADKVAILDLVSRYFAGEVKLEDETLVSLGKAGSGMNPEIVDALKNGRAVSYGAIRSAEDFKLCLFTWPGDLNYGSSAGIVLKKNLYGKLRAFLPEGDAFCDWILQKAVEKLECLSSKSAI